MRTVLISEETIPLLKEDVVVEIRHEMHRAVDDSTSSYIWRGKARGASTDAVGSKVYFDSRWWIVDTVTVWVYVDEEGDND